MADFFYKLDATSIVDNPKYFVPARQVFGNFLFENELGILFGDTNSAKSILSTDIGISFSSHVSHWDGSMTDETIDGETYYYDLEQSTRQFARRYMAAPFRKGKFERVSFSILQYGEAGTEHLISEVKSRMKANVSQLIIIDNLQCILTQNFSPTKVKALMQQLKMLKDLHPLLTILLVAHTTKRDLNKPLNQNSMSGSKVIANFADSIFGISESVTGSSCRYIKQIKSREVSRADEVAICEIYDHPYLHLELIEYDTEANHLAARKGASRISKIDEFVRNRILELNEDGASLREIQSELGISKSHVHRILREQV